MNKFERKALIDMSLEEQADFWKDTVNSRKGKKD